MTTDYRALCAELLDEVAARPLILDRELIARARAALAQTESEAVEPTDEELLSIAADCFAPVMIHYARAVLARYGHQPAQPAEGEAAELVAWLRNIAEAGLGGLDELNASRAADLLEQRHPAPVPVSERLPGVEDCDEMGCCWWYEDTEDCCGVWSLDIFDHEYTHWLPADALPLPQGEVEP